jgi:PAS domain S-box-containing protein
MGRNRGDEALRLSEERYAHAMEGSDAGHWDWNPLSDEIFISARARELLGLAPEARFHTRAELMAQVPMHTEDRAAMPDEVRACLASGADRYQREYRVLPRPGETRWLRSCAKVSRDAAGRAVRMTGSLTDVTENRLAAEALRESEVRYALAMEAAEEGHWDWDVASDDIYVSPRINQLFGLPAGQSFSKRAELVAHAPYHPDDVGHVERCVREALAGGSDRADFEYRTILASGAVRWLRARWKIARDPAGAALRITGVLTDVTERKLAADSLRESEARFRSLTELSSDWYWEQDEYLRFTYLSNEVEDLSGHATNALIGKTRWELEGVTPLSCSWSEHRKMLAARQPFRDFECCRIARDGSTGYTSVSGAPIFDQHGRFRGYRGMGRNITERKRIEEALRLSEERYARAMEAAHEGHWDWNMITDEIFVSPRMKEMFGFAPDREFASRTEFFALQPFHPEDRERLKATVQTALSGPAPHYEMDYRVLLPGGETRWLHSRGKVFRDAWGRPVRISGSVMDITERNIAEEALRRSEERWRAIFENSAIGVALTDLSGRFLATNSAYQKMLGYTEEEIGKLTFLDVTHEDDREANWQLATELLEGKRKQFQIEKQYRRKDGTLIWVSNNVSLVPGTKSMPRFIMALSEGITERKRAEEELGRLERQLRQAQRLEAMGTLAGGIAHDFNNILGAILGYGEMALRDAPKGSRLRRDLDSIITAGERGRALVDRVLAFSRSGVGEKVQVHVEKVVREALDILSAKLPGNVTLHAKLHAGRAAMLGDATQAHQVLMNLANNGVQAMAGGGTLRVDLALRRHHAPLLATTGTVPAGEYIVLSVTDAGTGIPAKILDRIFDPFFTTKEVGVGTGLGLSLVHGIVSEVGGAVDVQTTVGAGSAFTVYLPCTGAAPEDAPAEELDAPRGSGEHVLVVDDEEPLVRLATRTLEELGYAPQGFTSSSAALEAFRADPQRFDAVITDERMPSMSGAALIREVRSIRRKIPILLVSGYLGAAVVDRAYNAGADEVLKKPLSARELAVALARLL